MRRTILTIISSIILLIIGFYTWNSLFTLLLPKIGEVKYLSDSFTWGFRSSLIFGLSLAIIPILLSLVWKLTPVKNTQSKLLSSGIVLFVMAASLFSRREMIKFRAKNLMPEMGSFYSDHGELIQKPILVGIPLDSLNFEYYALIGVMVGCIVSFLMLRKKPNSQVPTANIGLPPA
jgi:hypothetical protein